MIASRFEIDADPDAAYESVRPLLRQTAARFRRLHGGDWEELLGQANLHYLRAARSWQPSRGACFATWVRLKVWRGLQEDFRNQRKSLKRQSPPRSPSAVLDRVPARDRFHLHLFLADLSGDAQLAVNTLFSLPLSNNVRGMRNELLGLLHGIGWEGERIVRILREVSETLTGERS